MEGSAVESEMDIVLLHTDDEQCRLENRSSSAVAILTHADDGSYYITWTVSIALAVPREEETDDPETPEKAKRNGKEASVDIKTRKAHSSYHIECQLFPGDRETVKVDLVVFGLVAKVYKEDEVKILRTWHEGDQTWIGLIQKVEARVNREMLISLLSHEIKLQIWNKREKLFSPARYDRLKALKLSQHSLENAADVCGVKSIIEKWRSLCERTANKSKKKKKDILCGSKTDDGRETAGVGKSSFKTSAIEIIHKDGSVSAELSLVPLIIGETSLTEHFSGLSAGVTEVVCDISLDKPLISEELKADLNPMVITILSAHSLPSSPVPLHVLREKCEPVYCQYRLPNLSMHKTIHHEHSTNIRFRDVSVILTGLMSPKELIDFLSGPPLEIEVHDRDRKLEEPSKPQVASDTELYYEDMSDVTYSNQRTTHMDHFGIASLNLCELLQGTKSLKAYLPIKCGPTTPQSAWSRSEPDTAAQSKPMPQGHYVAANSTLKVKVELACPIGVNSENSESDAFYSPFGRIIYIFDYNNFPVMTKLRSKILRINAAALHLDSSSQENIENALSNYVMNFKLDQCEDLDFVTGFHVLDKRTHIFVLEGLKHKAVRRLWEAVPMKLSGSAEEQVIVLYNSSMGFFERIYDSLDLSLSPIHLCEPLDTITRQPVLYIRGTVPLPCLQALTRLKQLCQTRQLRDVVQCDLFPSADMIVSMIEKFGLHDEQWRQKASIKTEDTDTDFPSLPIQMKRLAPLDMHNREYMKWRRSSQQKQVKDFIQENIEKVQKESKHLQRPEAAVFWKDLSYDKPIYNYSIQTLNSKQHTMELIRREMAKFPGRRFTYCQQYHSATVEPTEVASKPDPSSTLPTQVWISSMSSDRSKVHPRHPDEARVEELKKPWRENILHANMKPTLSRDKWAWSRRSEDFQLYGKPPPLFNPSPTSIYLAGDHPQQGQQEAARAQGSRWPKKLLPNSSTKAPGSSPPPPFKCHMGRTSEKLQDILKDEPKKYSLRKKGMILKPLPQLSVINLEDDREESEKRVALAPGPCADRSLSSRNNAIPRHPPQHDKSLHSGSSKQRSFLYKRTALPLTDEERSFFSLHRGVPDMKARTTDVQPSWNTAEARTHKNWILYAK